MVSGPLGMRRPATHPRPNAEAFGYWAAAYRSATLSQFTTSHQADR